MSDTSNRGVRVVVAGALTLLVVHTLGRFIYTPLLPRLIEDGMLTISQGADVATWNYVGYLLGAMLAIRWSKVSQIQRILPKALVLNVLCTLAQTQTESVAVLSFLRLVNGITNGVVFVQAPALILEWLVVQGRANLSGLMYLGVGAGLLVSSLLVSMFADVLWGPARWWPAFVAAVPITWWCLKQLKGLQFEPLTATASQQHGKATLFDRYSVPLFMSYAGAGLGYILPMTFLPTLVAQLWYLPQALTDGSWLLVALATLPSPWLWNKAGVRWGDTRALRWNYTLQLLGVAALILMPNTVGILLGSILVGSTFLGTVLLTQRLARTFHPHQGPKLSAALVALYGGTQLAGPWLARVWIDAGGSLQSAFWIGVGALGWGLLWSLLTPVEPQP